MSAPKLTRDQLRDLAAEHGYLLIPMRAGIVIEWRDEATGERLASCQLRHTNVLPFSKLPAASQGGATP